jgi:hypothetical protein
MVKKLVLSWRTKAIVSLQNPLPIVYAVRCQYRQMLFVVFAIRRPCRLRYNPSTILRKRIILRLFRGSTPVLLRCTCYSGFFRCYTVRAALAPREHGHRLRSAALRCAGSRFAASAKLYVQRTSIARTPPHPSHAKLCEGPLARKTRTARARRHGRRPAINIIST